jgi:hypothetical protein
MAPETVDALVLAARFDQTGLETSARQIVASAQPVSAAVARASDAGSTAQVRAATGGIR